MAVTEKYKIYLSEDIRSRLINDAEFFEFVRSDESVNLNGFLKELIVNYFEQYRNDSEELLNGIIGDITSVRNMKSSDAEALANRLISTYIRGGDDGSGKKTAVTLTVSGASYNVIKKIENNLLGDKSLSGYMKDMFCAYLAIPRHRREEIIFRDTYEDRSRAISGNRVMTFTSTTNSYKVAVEPYIIAMSKEEECNYLLCRDPKNGRTRTFRISRIRNAFVTSDVFGIDEACSEKLHAIAIRSPHSAAPDIHAAVRLTEAGMKYFKVIVKNRPVVSKIEGNVYHFDWPEIQLESYFRRFGKDAVVIKPKSLKAKLRNYYEQALDAYKR